MNTKANTIRILCYGDSNTFGKLPGSKRYERYASDERWTGVLQQKLGDGYEVIEEGLNSRTTDLDDPDPLKPGRNGLDLFLPIMMSHHPIDVVILMLGTNDLKIQYNRTSGDVAQSIRKYADQLKQFKQMVFEANPALILISPPHVKEIAGREIYQGAEEKSKHLASLYQQIADELVQSGEKCVFIDAAQYVESSQTDGVHLEKEGHERLAKEIHQSLIDLHLNERILSSVD